MEGALMATRTILLIPDTHFGWHELRRALAALPDCRVIGDTTDERRVLHLAHEHRPTMIITSPALDGKPAAPLLTALHEEISPTSMIVIFAADCASHHFVGGVKRWLSGYLLWQHLTPDTLRHRLAALLEGDIVLGNRAAIGAFAAALRGDGADPTIAAKVSERDRAVLRELAEGRSVAEIADTLACSERTVRPSIEHLEAILDAPDRFVLATKAMRAGLLR
jgi:DNA-binding NarL/FixJ family response regulator